MIIFRGCYVSPNGFEYQLFLADGTPAARDYSGRGEIVTRNGQTFVVLGNPVTDAYLPEYRMATEPTERSLQYVSGYNHALQQQRCKMGEWTADFTDGWRQGWEDKRSSNVIEDWRMVSKPTVYKAA